jgi:hypothetical protein
MVSIIAMILLSFSQSAYACSLEPTIKGGLMVSYPGSIDIAVAVAKARDEGLLPPPSENGIPDDVKLQQLLSDLQRLQSRLDKGRREASNEVSRTFSFVLVGPSLWSHFSITSGGVLANYHTNGPLSGKAVVLTHSSVLRALLSGSMTIDNAEKLGLIRYSGVNTDYIKLAFESGLQS